MSNISKKRLAIVLAVILVLVAIITPLAYFLTRPSDSGDKASSSVTAGQGSGGVKNGTGTGNRTSAVVGHTTGPGAGTSSGQGFGTTTGPGIGTTSGQGFGTTTGPEVRTTSGHGFGTTTGPGARTTTSRVVDTTTGPVAGNVTSPGIGEGNNTDVKGLNCYPEADSRLETITKEACEKRNCIFYINGDGPSCHFPLDKYGYTVSEVEDTPLGTRINLTRIGQGPYGGNIKTLVLEMEIRDENILRFKFDDPNSSRYKVPKTLNLPSTKASNPKYKLVIKNHLTFSFQVTRVDTGKVILDTSIGGLTFSDQFLQFATLLPSGNVYGLGENLHKSFKHDLTRTWPAWSRDQPPGHKAGSNLYGVHPFYTCVEDDNGNTHGVMLLNSNAQDYTFTPDPSLTFRTAGGILDFYVFMGPSPEQVIQQYTQAIGRPLMPPYWSLGFQVSRYGYNHIDNLKRAVENTKKYNIPHDVQYADIDHMDERKDFTVDNVNFAGLNDYFMELRNGGMKTIIILDPCLISNVSNYEPYERMKSAGANIKWPGGYNAPDDSKDETNAVLGYVWPKGKVVFPDFFKNVTRQIWQELIVKHHKTLTFDGLWIDMNEPANFGTNEERPFNWPDDARPYWSLKCPQNSIEDPPYRTAAAYLHDSSKKARLSDKTLCLSTVQGENNEYKHYDVHSLYGWSQTETTLLGARQATGTRSIVISRSTFPGSGQHAGHWLADNDSVWDHLAESIIGMLEFNLFGIPYIGADICGFFGNTTEEMCERWMQLGAFYPFCRNHNGEKNIPQDPGSMGDRVGGVSREAITTRYWLLPYLYTLFHHAHSAGNTVVRPLHHEFSTDPVTYSIDRQFLWGPALLISPILTQGQNELKYYLPTGRWYDYYTKAVETGPANKTIAVTRDSKTTLHVRGGYILPLQAPANNTHFSRRNSFKLIVALSDLDIDGGEAKGDLFWDDGESVDTFEMGNYYHATYSVSSQTLSVTVERNSVKEMTDLHYSSIEIWGVKSDVTDINIQKDSHDTWTFDKNHNKNSEVLYISNASFPLSESFQLHWGNFHADHLNRIDCFPEAQSWKVDVTRQLCEGRNCVYNKDGHSLIPACYFPTTDYGYSVSGPVKDTKLGFTVPLSRQGSGPFGKDIQSIIFSVEMRGNNILRFTFDDPATQRFKVPLQMNLPGSKGDNPLYSFKITNNQTFSFQIIRKSTGKVIWDTGVGGLTFDDQFLQISTRLPSQYVYGFGENLHYSLRHDNWYQTWPMWSRDEPTVKAWGKYRNHYGVHPYYLCVEGEDGNAHGVLLLNSNAQDYAFSPLPMLTYRTTGGILDFCVFVGSNPGEVTELYTGAIGRPYMPPYWALGFQLSRYGYNSIENIKAAVERTENADIPHDVQYADIDHMDERKDFTIDHVNFPGLKEYFQEIQKNGMKTIIILDPALISNETNYEPYERMKQVRGNIMWPDPPYKHPEGSVDTDGAALGYVWPKGKVVFPDFFKNETNRVWRELIVTHQSEVPFDGLWIDMNEPANFGTNEERPFNWPEKDTPYWSLKCNNNSYEDPPYRTRAAYNYDNDNRLARISDKTLCMETRQGNNDELMHYDVHSLYGWSQTESTLQGLREATGKRGMVISRSTFPGSGKHTGHWLGDNRSDWDDLRISIIGLLEFNLFGIPYVPASITPFNGVMRNGTGKLPNFCAREKLIGADICGFFDNTNAELCGRWMQLGAFYTFNRNHNGLAYIDQDPAALGEEVKKMSRDAIRTRYWLLPYLYTLFHFAHAKGSTVIRALLQEFPTDNTVYSIDEQFMWGEALLISPILYEKQHVLNMYVPEGRWYDYHTLTEVTKTGKMHLNIPVKSDSSIPLHLRGGYVIPMQEPAKNTQHSRKNPFTLKVSLDNSAKAKGYLFWDDGDSVDTYEHGQYYMATFVVESHELKMTIDHNTLSEMNNLFLSTVIVLGVEVQVNLVRLNSDNRDLNFTYNAVTKVLKITDHLPLNAPFTMFWTSATQNDYRKIDCYPEVKGGAVKVNHTSCQQRNCIYDDSDGVDVPDCYFQQTNYGYMVSGDTQQTPRGFKIPLSKISSVPGPFGKDISDLTFEIEELDNNLLRFKFYDTASSRFEVPVPLNLPNTGARAREPRYRLEITNNDTFSFRVTRRSSGAVLWDTSVGGFTFEDQFLQLATRLPSNNIYGFGENTHDRFRHNLWFKTWPMWSRDQWTMYSTYENHYGVHPFYMAIEDGGQSHGVLLLNSNAQDYSFTPLPMLIYRTIGGILDFYMFLGPEPENVVQQYTEVVGRPYMPPYWSLGFQLCKYGYGSLTELRNAVTRTRDAGIPHDVQYADIDHMDERRDFTVDPVNFAGLSDYFKSLRDGGMRIIIILDPALISNNTDYKPYDAMNAVHGNIMWPSDGSVDIPLGSNDTDNALLGYVWPMGKAVFPDFFKNVTRDVWGQLIKNHSRELYFDGLWIDMNEPANFGTNEEKPFNWPEEARPYWSLKCPQNDLEDPPYRTRAAYHYDNDNRLARISDKTVCMSAIQGNTGEYKHYDVHSLYGWSQTEPTLRALREVTGQRGIVVTRSTFVTSGKEAGHWLGDNASKWRDMQVSVTGILEFNLFGIPYIGADICGFFENTTPELCKRWMQLGAFYTYSRNHNGIDFLPQDPGVLGDDVARASREAIETRYRLLPYLYTLFYRAHTRGNTVIRPLHHEYPADKTTYNIDRQFLWGPALMISPILTEGQTSISIYTPKGRWYDYYTGSVATKTGGNYVHLPVTPDSPIPLHLRGGHILPLQRTANNTHYSRQTPFTLIVALAEVEDRGLQARGELYWDDGQSVDTYQNGQYYHARFDCKENTLTMDVQRPLVEMENLYLEKVEIWGLDETIYYATVNGTQHIHISQAPNKKLTIEFLNHRMSDNIIIQWSNKEPVDKDDADRLDCLPDADMYKDRPRDECNRRRCLWSPSQGLNVPWCFIDVNRYGYRQNGNAVIAGTETTYNLEWRNMSSMFGGDIRNIALMVDEISNDVLRVKIYDPGNTRFEVPVPVTPQRGATTNALYEVEYLNDAKWSTDIGGLTFTDQFLQLSTRLASNNIYGFGEQRHTSLRHDLSFRKLPLFARDQPPGWGGGNLYGVHPFHMVVEDDAGNSHAVLLLNSNAMEIVLQPAPALTYRTVGGVLDFYFFMGPQPESAIQQYTQAIGRPYLPPYWSLGFQLCRYGYNNLETIQAVVNRTIAAEIPHDVQYADIDHMDERKDFTVDMENFRGLPEYFKQLQDMGMKTIIILDPALVSNYSDYTPYNEGLASDVYIKWPAGQNPDYDDHKNDNMLGYVWPKGKTVFPDFLLNATHTYWKNQIVKHHNNLTFDGLWIDMNEPAVFGTNEQRAFNWPEKDVPYWTLKCPTSKWDDPPYKPRAIFGPRLSDKTLCMVGLQDNGRYRHYDVHSLYGWSQTEPTLVALREATGKRGIVVTRSTFPSSGRYGGHWLGDNNAKWSHVHDSVIGIIEFNLFGIPYIGADICGFFDETTPELCERWMQLGAFYTYSRNHNGLNNKPQDPAYFGPAIAASSRRVLEIRYSLLPHLYTLFYHAHTQGGTVIRSLLHEFPSDKRTWSLDTQFLWGSGFMIAPVLMSGTTTVDVYFPDARWFDYYTGMEMSARVAMDTVDAPRDTIPLFVRGGTILPTQQPANTTYYSRMNPMGLIVAPDDSGNARGDLFWDDGDGIDTISSNQFFLATFSLSNNTLTMTVTTPNSVVNGLTMDTITVYGVTSDPDTFTVGGTSRQVDKIYNSKYKVLHLMGLNLQLETSFTITWTTLLVPPIS